MHNDDFTRSPLFGLWVYEIYVFVAAALGGYLGTDGSGGRCGL